MTNAAFVGVFAQRLVASFFFQLEPKTSKDLKQVPKPEHMTMFPREQLFSSAPRFTMHVF